MNYIKGFFKYSSYRFIYSILRFVLIAIILYLLFNYKVNASERNTIYIDYNDDYIFDNINPEFLGENGYLEIIRKLTDNQHRAILFTTNDIYFIKYNTSTRSITFNYDYLNQNTIDFSLNCNRNCSVISLTDYKNFDEFYQAVINEDYKSFTTLNFEYDYDFNITTTDFNLFNMLSSDFILPYYNSGTTYFYSDIFDFNVNNIIDTNSGKNDLDYYNNFGYIDKNKTKSYVGSIDYVIPFSEITSFTTSIKLNSNSITDNSQFAGIDIFAKKVVSDTIVDENGNTYNESYYYYEDINFKTGKTSNYCSYDITGGTTSGTLEVNDLVLNCVELEDYESLYLKVMFNGATNVSGVSNNYTSTGSGAGDIKTFINTFNRIYERVIINEHYLTRNNAILFSTPLDYYNHPLYYSDALYYFEDVNYPTVNTDIFDYSNKKTIDKGTIGQHFTNPFNYNDLGINNKLDTNVFGSSDTTGYYFWANNNLPDNHVSTLYTAFTPVDENGNPIIYIGGGSISSDFNSFTGSYIDSSGNINSTTDIDGDFSSLAEDNLSFGEAIIYSIQKWFLPSDEFFADYLNKTNEFFTEKLGILYLPLNIFTTFSEYLLTLPEDNTHQFNIPSIKDPIYNVEILKAQTFSFNDVISNNETFSTIYDIYLLLTDVFIIFLLMQFGKRKFNSLFGGGGEN